jgi:hypothetical protein
MNTREQSSSLFLVLLSLFVASCSPGQSPVTATPTASSTPPPTLTPTSTPSPTPSPTPVPAIGQLLRSDNWEATILQAAYRKSISIAGTVYTPKPGYMGFDVILKVKNLNPAANPSTNVENDEIVDEQGQAQLATCWGALDVAKAQGKDLLNLTFVGCQTGNIYSMQIDSESYLRFHFTIKDTALGQTITFKFEDLPAVPFIINK